MPHLACSRWRRRTSLALLVAMTLNFAATAHAQGPHASVPDSTPTTTRSPLMQPSAVWAPASDPVLTQFGDTTAAKPQTYWATGAIIGGASLGLLSMAMAAGFCGYNETGDENCTMRTIGGFLLGAGVGVGLGAFIGARFPKHPKAVEAEPTN